jgi:LemA protein
MASTLAIVAAAALLLVLLVVLAYLVSAYNSLVRLDNKADQAEQNIDVKLKQRQDTLSKLVETVSGYLDHEEQVLTELTEAREAAERAETPKEEAEADAQVRRALSSFSARAEEYPELRSTENVGNLQEEIVRLEEEISDRREFYNDSVTLFNTRIKQIPYVLFANAMGYSERELFEAEAGEIEDVDVSAAFDSDESAASGTSADAAN